MMPTSSAVIYAEIDLPEMALPVIALLLLVVLPLSAVLGHGIGRRSRERTLSAGREVDKVTGETSLSAVLALLGLLLAFSFNNALTLAQTRKLSLIDESAALGTAFLRADYLAEPGRTELKQAIYDYTQTRVVTDFNEFNSNRGVLEFLDRSLQAQAKLWPVTLEATADPVPAPIKTFVAGAVNEAIDAHLYRMQSFSVPVSELTHVMVLAAALTSLFLLGNRSGMMGRVLSWRTFVFSGFLWVLMLTVVDVKRATSGLIQTDQSPMLVTLFDMEQGLR